MLALYKMSSDNMITHSAAINKEAAIRDYIQKVFSGAGSFLSNLSPANIKMFAAQLKEFIDKKDAVVNAIIGVIKNIQSQQPQKAAGLGNVRNYLSPESLATYKKDMYRAITQALNWYQSDIGQARMMLISMVVEAALVTWAAMSGGQVDLTQYELNIRPAIDVVINLVSNMIPRAHGIELGKAFSADNHVKFYRRSFMKYPNLVTSLKNIANYLDDNGQSKRADVIDHAIRVIVADTEEPLGKCDECGSKLKSGDKDICSRCRKEFEESLDENSKIKSPKEKIDRSREIGRRVHREEEERMEKARRLLENR